MTPYNFKTTVAATEPTDYDAALEKLLAAECEKFVGAANAVMLTASMLTSPRPTCLRVRADGSLEVVELDDNGKVVEPVRCTCRGALSMGCAIHESMT